MVNIKSVLQINSFIKATKCRAKTSLALFSLVCNKLFVWFVRWREQCKHNERRRAAPQQHLPLYEGLTRSRAREARGQRDQRPRRAPPIHLTPSVCNNHTIESITVASYHLHLRRHSYSHRGNGIVLRFNSKRVPGIVNINYNGANIFTLTL